jgi:hypothetical protein
MLGGSRVGLQAGNEIQDGIMGIIICSRHGQSGITFVCQHLRIAVQANEAISDIHRWRYHFDYAGDEPLHYHFCSLCMNELRSHGLPESGAKSSSEQEDDRIEALLARVWDGTDAVCRNCRFDAVGASDLARFDESS